MFERLTGTFLLWCPHVWKINWYAFHSLMYHLPGPFSWWEFKVKSHFLSACANWLCYSKFSNMMSMSRGWKFIHTAHRCTSSKNVVVPTFERLTGMFFTRSCTLYLAPFSRWELTERSSQKSCFLSACADWLTASVTLSSAACWLYWGDGSFF